MHTFSLRIIFLVFAVGAFFLSARWSVQGFDQVQDFKRLERLVPSSIMGLLPGENQVVGFAENLSGQLLLKSPKTQTPSLYYRYLLEKEERDSDGDTRWVTVKNQQRGINFRLYDNTGQADVQVENMVEQIRWLMPPRFTETRGGYRYTEWRIEPQDKITLYAWADLTPTSSGQPQFSLSFSQQGAYQAIISSFSGSQVRSIIGEDASIAIWLGISALILAVTCLVYVLQIHRILAYLALLSTLTMISLGGLGVTALKKEVGDASARFEQRLNQTQEELGSMNIHSLDEKLAQGDALSWQALRAHALVANLQYQHSVYLAQISNFPESWMAWWIGAKNLKIPSDLLPKDGQQLLIADQKTTLSGSALWWVFGGLAVFLVFTGIGFYFARVKRMIENIPTSSPAGVSFGLNEISGELALVEDRQLTSPLTKNTCVWFRYLVEERRGSGKNAKWVTMSDDKQGIPFMCRDSEGGIKIDPTGAEIITKHKRTERRGDRRYSEWLLQPEDTLYALGQAVVDPSETDRLLFSKPTEKISASRATMFILSNYPEKDIMMKKAITAMFNLALAIAGLFATGIFYLGMQGEFSASDYLLAAFLPLGFLTCFVLVLHYNDLVFLRQRLQRNWANIQVSLKKRADLVPPLLNIVKNYQVHEQTLQTKLTYLRQLAKTTIETPAQAQEVIAESRQLAHTFKLLVEDYPELKADKLINAFFNTLRQLENEIALMRQGFNDSVMVYNTRIQSIPDVFFAGACGFQRHPLWDNN